MATFTSIVRGYIALVTGTEPRTSSSSARGSAADDKSSGRSMYFKKCVLRAV